MRLAPRAVRLALGAIALLWLGMSTSAAAASSHVAIQNFAFVPNALTVSVGDTVTWTNSDAASHTVTFNSGGGSGTLATGASFSFTFTSAGTFAYHCAIHPSMTGTVTVTGPSTAPPTPAPTAPPTPIPTPAPTLAPTPQPTSVPTPRPSAAASPSASAIPSPSASAHPSPSALPSTGVAGTTASASASASAAAANIPGGAAPPGTLVAAQSDRGPSLPLIAGALLIVAGTGTVAWLLLRRSRAS